LASHPPPRASDDDRSGAEARPESSESPNEPPSTDAPVEGSNAALDAQTLPAEPLPEGPTLAAVIAPPPQAAAEEAYHQRARLAEDRLQEVLTAYRKIKVENDAYQERQKRNLERRFEQRRERLLLRFIDILDNLDRALEAAQTAYTDASMLEGMILVRTQLLQTLQEEGLERIPVLGLPYDPHVSEAVGTTQVEDPDHHGLVTKELLRGYRFGGRVVRASRVLLGENAQRPPTEVQPAPEVVAQPEVEETVAPAVVKEEGPSLDEIIARVEEQEALFAEVFPPPPAAASAAPAVSDEAALEAQIDAALGVPTPSSPKAATEGEAPPAGDKDPQKA